MKKQKILICIDSKSELFEANKLFLSNKLLRNELVFSDCWETELESKEKFSESLMNERLRSISCTIVLIDDQYQDNKWFNFIIEKSWERGNGLLGIILSNFEDQSEEMFNTNINPFEKYYFGFKKLSEIVKTYCINKKEAEDNVHSLSKHLLEWVNTAIGIRKWQQEIYGNTYE